MKRLLIATSNKGKIAEYKEIFKELLPEVELMSLNDFGIEEYPEETEETFEGNAIIKAKFYYERSKIPTLADDGGIEIDHLNGEPGVKSRRWPGYDATDEELVQMTFEKLAGVPWEKRGAQLRAVIAIAVSKDDIHTTEGIWRGYIVENRSQVARLIPGYPFRSLFYIPETKTVMGELPFEEEARIGHRRKALERVLPFLNSI